MLKRCRAVSVAVPVIIDLSTEAILWLQSWVSSMPEGQRKIDESRSQEEPDKDIGFQHQPASSGHKV